MNKCMFVYKGEGVQTIGTYAIPPMQKTTLAIAYLLHSRTVYNWQHANNKNASEFEGLKCGFSFFAINRIEPFYLSYNLIG